MTSIPPPTKPPRGVKHGKETSGLLMSVIRTLSASESNEQRDREKAKLEKEYKRSDQKLDELVSLHDQDVPQVMQLFGKLSSRVTSSREKIHAIKENLNACKMLLSCRRDELKKLWLEGIEQKHVLQMLEEIDQLRDVPSQLGSYLNKKHYLHATQLLVSALSLGEGTLEGVEALREVRAELQAKKQQLHLKLLEDLSRHLYWVSTQEIVSLRRQGSGRENSFQRSSELRASARASKNVRRALYDVSAAFTNNHTSRTGLKEDNSQLSNIQEDIDASDPEANSEHFMAILVECLALLNKLPEAVETLKVQMQTELLSLISRTTQQLITLSAPNEPQILPNLGTGNSFSSPRQPSPIQTSILLDLLQIVFDQLRQVATAHAVVLGCLTRAAEKYRADVRLYEMADVWSKIQAVLQLLLTDYLDIQNTAGEPRQTSSFSEPASDISAFFSRKKNPRQKKTPLFKFDYSSHGLAINSYLNTDELDSNKKDSGETKPSRAKTLVIQADPRNVTIVFVPMMRFVTEIESALNLPSGRPCTLNAFLADYVKEVFLGRHHASLAAGIESATKSNEAWKATLGPVQIRSLGGSRPILQSTVRVADCINELYSLMKSLPTYSEHFLGLVCTILRNYRESSQTAYRSYVYPEGEISQRRSICSAAWLKDDDITRFLKSLPNWTDLQARQTVTPSISTPSSRRNNSTNDTSQTPTLRRQETGEEESPEQIRQRNLREAEILASNLGEGGINANEIISDMRQLKGLAHLHESMEWFVSRILSLANELPISSDITLSETSLQELKALATDFEELANTCLLVLHLEVRVQCFHYLLPKSGTQFGTRFVATGGGSGLDAQEPDKQVLELSRVLTSVDEALSSNLHPRKTKYIFEGLGHLMAKILISSAQYLERIDDAGIQKMCRNIFALQQTLTNITMAREVALDHARHYFELFYLSPEEILTGVMEKGPEFSELEYMNAFQLLGRSQSEPDNLSIHTHLARLSDILGEVGVTV